MLEDDLDFYRSLTPDQRLAIALDLGDFAWRCLDVPDREMGDRKWAAWHREHDRSNEAMLAGLGFPGAERVLRR